MNYKDKKILFSTDLSITGYKETLENYLLKKFKLVDFIESGIPLKKDRNIYFKSLRELKRKGYVNQLYEREIEKYCKKVMEEKNTIYDYFLVVAGAEFSEGFIKKLRKLNIGIKCIIFIWDKLETTPLSKSINAFDKIYTFDKKDAEIFNFNFLSSFYIDECKENIADYKEREYDLYYIGRLRSVERYYYIKSLFEYSRLLKLRFYLKLWVTDKTSKCLPVEYEESVVSYEKIDYIKNLDYVKKSRIVLELIHGNQTGLTLRAIESIATQTKLITTNKDIVNYDFYNSENILIIENEKDILNISRSFFEKPYKKLSIQIVEKYSVKGFIDTIFNGNF